MNAEQKTLHTKFDFVAIYIFQTIQETIFLLTVEIKFLLLKS